MKRSSPEPIAQPELGLLLACARTPDRLLDGTLIRATLRDGIDWTAFTSKAINNGMESLIVTIGKVAPDLVPDELLHALRGSGEFIQSANRLIMEAFSRTAAALANQGIDVIWFSGPVLGIHAYGDLGLRRFGTPTFLVRERHADSAIAALREIGYRQKTGLTAAQLGFIRYLDGREILFNPSLGSGALVYTRLTPINMALDINHQGLWKRAQTESIARQTVQTLAPEDEVLTLSIPTRRDGVWKLGEVCDFARLIASRPSIDWNAILERARSQGRLRMLRLAVALAHRYLDAGVADGVLPTEHRDPILEAMVARTVAHWHADKPSEPLRLAGFSRGMLQLHDGSIRKARYVARALILPTASHVSRLALPQRLTNSFNYALLKVIQDAAMLPLLRTYREMRVQTRRLRDFLARYELGLALIPVSSQRRLLLRRHHSARVAARRVLAQIPNNASAWQDLGDASFHLGRYKEALDAYDRALATAPEDLMLWRKRAEVIKAGGARMSRFDTQEETKLNAQDANAWARHAASLAAAKRFVEATSAADRALALDPSHLVAARVGIRCRILACDWRRSQEDENRVAHAYATGLAILTPSANRAICDSEEQNLVAAQLWSRRHVRSAPPLSDGRKYLHERIRLAYVCSEYHDHPVGRQIVGVLEHHDRSRFEINAISLGVPISSPIRQRIEAACDKFVTVHGMTDERAAAIVSEMEIDIAIDLDRFASRARPGILARRPAPVQVTYFGNAGTTGATFLDYIVADRTLIPHEQFRHYPEKVIYLPNSYQCNDSKRQLPNSPLSRAKVGLPGEGFVYCCFNQNYKIRPAVFDVWIRLLHACPGSVLWLLGDEPHAVHNLRREAAARGIASERVVFAPLVPNDEHIARQRLADLFLDTLPCNAHATASDALWAGLPILTCLGNTFAGRVGASLLRAVGLPEMVTESLAQYEAMAMALTRDPLRLAAIKAKLERNRNCEPLFDTPGFTRDLERAFEAIWRRQQAGLPPEPIAL